MPETVANCPRCGYDLRGHARTWAGEPPATGTCVECGLEFSWADVLDPSRVTPPWCVEQDRHGRLRFSQLVGTAVRTLYPPGFWSRIGMTGRSRPGRILIYLALITALLYVPFALALGKAADDEWLVMSSNPWVTTTLTRRVAVWHAVSRPWSARSVGTFIAIGRNNARAFPSSTPISLAQWLVDWLAPMCFLGFVSHLATAAAFVALPISRRRAKVRLVHIVRVTLYGLAWFVPLTAAGMWAWSVEAAPSSKAFGLWRAQVVVLMIPVVLAAWWWSAIRCYLRMSQAELVAASVVVIGILFTLAVGATIWS